MVDPAFHRNHLELFSDGIGSSDECHGILLLDFYYDDGGSEIQTSTQPTENPDVCLAPASGSEA